MRIVIVSLTGRRHQVDVQPSDTVEDVKYRIQDFAEAYPYDQRLIFLGKQLMDQSTMSDCHVVEQSKLHLVLRLGGAPRPKYVKVANRGQPQNAPGESDSDDESVASERAASRSSSPDRNSSRASSPATSRASSRAASPDRLPQQVAEPDDDENVLTLTKGQLRQIIKESMEEAMEPLREELVKLREAVERLTTARQADELFGLVDHERMDEVETLLPVNTLEDLDRLEMYLEDNSEHNKFVMQYINMKSFGSTNTLANVLHNGMRVVISRELGARMVAKDEKRCKHDKKAFVPRAKNTMKIFERLVYRFIPDTDATAEEKQKFRKEFDAGVRSFFSSQQDLVRKRLREENNLPSRDKRARIVETVGEPEPVEPEMVEAADNVVEAAENVVQVNVPRRSARVQANAQV